MNNIIIEVSKCITLKVKINHEHTYLSKEKFANPQKFQPSKFSACTVLINEFQSFPTLLDVW